MSWKVDMLRDKMDEFMEDGWRLLRDDEVLDMYDVLDGFEIKKIVDVGDENINSVIEERKV